MLCKIDIRSVLVRRIARVEQVVVALAAKRSLQPINATEAPVIEYDNREFLLQCDRSRNL